MARGAGEGGEDEQGVEPEGAQRAVTELAVHGAVQAVGDGEDVGHEEEVEAALLERAGDVGVVAGGEDVAVGGGMAPAAVDAGDGAGADEGGEVHHAMRVVMWVGVVRAAVL